MRSAMRPIGFFLAALLAASWFGNDRATADAYPERSLELIVPWGQSGGADQLARLVARLAEPILGKRLAVVNVPGGTGGTGLAKLLAAPADGYSMAVYIADSHALLASKQPHWSMSDITPVAVMMKGPSFLFVREDSPFKSWGDFVKYAKARPGSLKVATLGFGSIDTFALRTIERAAGIDIVQIPYAKPSERYTSILGGRADALYEQIGDVSELVKQEKIRPLLLFAEKRMDEFSDVPASYELGFKVALPQFRAIVVRSGTPPEIVKKLADVLAKVFASPEFKEFLKEQHATIDSFEDPDGASIFLQEQLDELQRISIRN
jgi:tripartite-type tricarboxylate transporter receptor subunit TctC